MRATRTRCSFSMAVRNESEKLDGRTRRRAKRLGIQEAQIEIEGSVQWSNLCDDDGSFSGVRRGDERRRDSDGCRGIPISVRDGRFVAEAAPRRLLLAREASMTIVEPDQHVTGGGR